MAAVSSLRRVLPFAAAIVCLLPGCGEKLTEYRSEEGRFRILLPGTPKTVSDRALGKGVQAVQFEERSGDFTVAWSDPQPARATPGTLEQLDLACNRAIDNLQGKALSRRSITLGNHPGREMLVEGPDGKVVVRLRLYLVNGRLYQVAAGGARWWVDRGTTDKVLDSFAVLAE